MIKKYLLLILVVSGFLIWQHSAQALNIDTGTDFLYAPNVKTISMDFKNEDLTNVLKIFSQQSGMNFIAATSVADKQINLYLEKVPVEEALERILFANDLTYEVTPGSNVFVVKELDQPDIEMITRVYPLKHASVSTSKIYSTLTIGDEGGDGATVPGSGGDEGGAGPASMLEAVTALIGGEEAVGSVVEDQRTNSLIVTTTPSRFSQIDQLMARLDVRIPQILIEAEMLDISKNTADLLGAKFGNTPFQFSGAEKLGLFPFDFDNILDDNLISNTPGFRDGFFSRGDDGGRYIPSNTNFSGLSVLVQFLRTQSDTKSLARPRILTLNNETAEIKIQVNEALGVESVEEDENGNRTFTVRREDTGVFLTVTPQANIESGEITLAVEPRVIQAVQGRALEFSGEVFSFIAPEERGSKTLLKVMDGDTVIIGGLLRTETENVNTNVPFLSKIPILGAGFRHKDVSETQRELIIFLTPHIVKETIAANLQGRQNIPMVREQGIPRESLQQINKDLSLIENQRY